MSSSPELDYLFEDTPSPFIMLPGELRNNIYEHVFTEEIVRINEAGSVIQHPLTCVSKQLRFETEAYNTPALKNPTTKIHAQICGYNPKPLIRQMERLSSELKISKEDLVQRTKVFFIGEPNFGNLGRWMQNHLEEPEQFPVFAHDKANVCGYGQISVFEGKLSLKSFARQYNALHYFDAISNEGPKDSWSRTIGKFLCYVEEADWDLRPRRRDENAKNYFFKIIMRLHHEILQLEKMGPESKFVKGMKRKRGCLSNQENMFDMVEVLHRLHVDCNSALLGLRLGPQWQRLDVDAIDYEE
jgi:hypothetical protein